MKKSSVVIEEIGTVIEVQGAMAKISGLPSVMAEELVEVGSYKGIVLGFKREFTKSLLDQQMTYAMMLEGVGKIKPGQTVKRTGKILELPVSDDYLGKIVDPLGRDMDSGIMIKSKETRSLEQKPPSIIEREQIKQPLETGIKVIDALFPIGRGQRELVLGDRKTGKTTLAVDTILNQKDVICIFAAVGKKKSEILQVFLTLKRFGALRYTTIVAAPAGSSTVWYYLAPFSAMVLAEYFRDKGRDVLVVFDDLTKHAWSWRELSLLLNRPPGREAYPGDIFYLHSRLLERAGKLSSTKGGGSITALPICETREGDISEYIPTNLISITDGQIYLEKDIFQRNRKPAVNIGLSVSRIGSQAQHRYLKEATKGLKLLLSQHQELKKLIQLESLVSTESQKRFHRAELLFRIFNQPKHHLVSGIDQSIIYRAIIEGFFDNVDLEKISSLEEEFYKFIDDIYPGFKKKVAFKGFNEEIISELKAIVKEFKIMS